MKLDFHKNKLKNYKLKLLIKTNFHLDHFPKWHPTINQQLKLIKLILLSIRTLIHRLYGQAVAISILMTIIVVPSMLKLWKLDKLINKKIIVTHVLVKIQLISISINSLKIQQFMLAAIINPIKLNKTSISEINVSHLHNKLVNAPIGKDLCMKDIHQIKTYVLICHQTITKRCFQMLRHHKNNMILITNKDLRQVAFNSRMHNRFMVRMVLLVCKAHLWFRVYKTTMILVPKNST